MAISKIIGSGLGTINSPVDFTSADNLTQITITSTDADADTGPKLDLIRNSANPAANDILANIRFMGEDSAGNSLSYIGIFGQLIDPTDGSEDGSLEIDVRLAGTNRSRIISNATETIFNDDSQNLDFRVESNGNANMLFVDGGEDRIGIGTNSPAQLVDIQSAATFSTRLLATGNNTRAQLLAQSHTSGGADVNMILGSFGDSTRGEVSMNTNHPLRFYTNNNPNKGLELETDGDVNILDGNLVIGTAAHGIDFSAQTQSSSTTVSELLDHYEEGTWAPVITPEGGSAAGITVNHATYTKVGRLVSVVWQVTIDSISGTNSSNAIELTGMPFTLASANAGGPNIAYTNLTASMTGTLALQGNTTSKYRIVNLNGATGLNASDHLQASSVLRAQFIYHAE